MDKTAAVLPPTTTAVAGAELLRTIAGAGLTGAALRLLAASGYTDANALTNIAFWSAHPDLFGTKLQPSQPGFAALAAEWMQIHDVVERWSRRKGGDKRGAAATSSAATKPPPGLVPAAEVAAQSAESAGAKAGGASKAGTSDKYFVQDVGHYQDADDTGKTRVWLYGSSGQNVCNMTSLTMGLVSLAGESAVREKMIALLRSSGMHVGASVRVGGKFVPLAESLDNPKIVARVETIDLVTAVAIGKSGVYKDVTEADTIAHVARETGLATAEVATGPVRLSNPKVRASAAHMLAEGKRVIAGTVNHYIYLIDVRDDGVVVHDPAGARVTPDLTAPIFLHSGNASGIAREFLRMDTNRRETALRRVSTNAHATAVINELAGIAAMPKADQAVALRELAKAHPQHISTGALNFYATSEFAANDLRLRVTLSSAKT